MRISGRWTPILLLSLAVACRRPATTPPAAPATPNADSRPDIVLVTIEGLRADLAAAEIRPPTRLHIAQIAAHAIVFGKASTPSPLPVSALAAMHSGRSETITTGSRPMPADVPVAAAELTTSGYRCVAFVSTPRPLRAAGLARGFVVFDDSKPETSPYRTPSETTAAAVAELTQPSELPRFLWVHWALPLGSVAVNQSVPSDLLSAAERSDLALGELLAAVAAAGRRPKALVLAASNGFDLREHGVVGSGLTLFEPALAVPLLISAPGYSPRPSDRLVSTAAIAATLLDLGGVAASRIPGRSLLDIAFDTGSAPPQVGFSPLPAWLGTGAALRSYRVDAWKWIEQGTQVWLFDLAKDPQERVNLRAKEPARAAEMAKAAPPAPESSPMPSRDELRAWGYLH